MQKIIKFLAENKSFFDIAAYKCKFNKCKCERSCKVPRKEQAFLNNKHSECKIIIGVIDKI